MKIPTVNNCCFCFTLPTGGLIMGWLGVIGGLLGVIGSIILMSVDVNSLYPNTNPADLNNLKAIYYAILVIYLLISIGTLIVSGLLIKGTKSRNFRLITPWLIVQGICVVLYLISAFLQISTSIASFVSGLISALIVIYFWICIYSLYKDIQSN